ncbi:TetR family transcriptional regulator C-terminal domain-containing protein [Streptomyces sasae]|uniref:TetR family transcriptional regulator C-terminal domain-containing protein n=1 Tax=Streptomyces sasae TaxID=1266772 RepID=UPI0037448780
MARSKGIVSMEGADAVGQGEAEVVVVLGFARGCLVGNFGAEVAHHSEEIRSAVQRGFQRWAAHIARADRGTRKRARSAPRSRYRRPPSSSSVPGRAL